MNPIKIEICGEMKYEKHIYKILSEQPIQIVIIESFKLFPWKSKTLYWSNLRTVEIIGAIKGYCSILNLPFILQDPNVKKFYDDKKLKFLNMYEKESPHLRDAIRHGLYYLHFKLKKEIKPYVTS